MERIITLLEVSGLKSIQTYRSKGEMRELDTAGADSNGGAAKLRLKESLEGAAP
jgi:hypothetical protein